MGITRVNMWIYDFVSCKYGFRISFAVTFNIFSLLFIHCVLLLLVCCFCFCWFVVVYRFYLKGKSELSGKKGRSTKKSKRTIKWKTFDSIQIYGIFNYSTHYTLILYKNLMVFIVKPLLNVALRHDSQRFYFYFRDLTTENKNKSKKNTNYSFSKRCLPTINTYKDVKRKKSEVKPNKYILVYNIKVFFYRFFPSIFLFLYYLLSAVPCERYLLWRIWAIFYIEIHARTLIYFLKQQQQQQKKG